MAGKAVTERAVPPETAQGPSDESRMIAAITYIFGIFVAVLVLLLRKNDSYAKYHAAQAILMDLAAMLVGIGAVVIGAAFIIAAGIATMGVGFFLGFGVVWLAIMLFGIGNFALRLLLAFQAFSGKRFGLPIIGAQAEKIAAG